MSSDISRQRFKPANNFSSVLMQQGRVQLDADWNEWNGILDRRWRSETIDIIGRGVVPLETPNGFEIQLDASDGLTIGRGRIYVDGLQAENHGAGQLEFDPVLGETRGLDPVSYAEQPYFPNPPALPGQGGPHLVYLDVWEREVTSVENSDLIENAVGVDTTTRLQTVWQVRLLPNVGANATCGDPDEQVPGWLDIIRPSAGRLTTKAVGVASPDDPCLIPPSGGYRGLENRTYRVEIHDGGAVGTATFKWSRDNASLATGINHIEGDKTLTADRVMWDSARRFSPGDWIEVSDDVREFAQVPGEIRRIASVDDASRTITLDVALTSGIFATNDKDLVARNTRIKRWDQAGIVRQSDGKTYVDLDASGGSGLIDVPPAATSLILEDGVEVTFTTAPNDGEFRPGDYWIFVARTADASVEELDAAPPRGIHHHYCRLALVTFPDAVTDCRIFWPPASGGKKESCACTICVTQEENSSGTLTIQQAVNQVIQAGGGTVCLGPGIFNIAKAVQLNNAVGLHIRGQGAATIVVQPRADSAFVVSGSRWCTLACLTIQSFTATSKWPAIRLSNSLGLTLEGLIVTPARDGDGPLAAVLLESGFLLQTKIRDNFFRAQGGVIFQPDEGDKEAALLLGSFYCQDNMLQCSDSGIRLDGASYYTSDTVLARNFIFGTAAAGISALGLAFPELEISGNTINPQKGDGIVVGTGGVRICDNRISNLGLDAADGIRLVEGLQPSALTPILVRGNRCEGLLGNGISIETGLIAGLIEGNVFREIQANGIIMQPGSLAGALQILANELINIAVTTDPSEKSPEIAAIYLRGVFEGAISNNAISDVGTNSPLAAVVAGVRVASSVDVRISDNSITNIAPATQFSQPAAGILAEGPFINLEVADNVVRRQLVDRPNDGSPWQAIRIEGASSQNSSAHFANLNEQSAAGQMNTISTFASSAAPAGELVGIVGNVLRGYGRGLLAEVIVSGSCRFSDNHCWEVDEKVDIEIALAAATVIAANNRIESARNTRSLVLKTDDKSAFTVLGNIVGGSIVANGAALSTPWQPLNVYGS